MTVRIKNQSGDQRTWVGRIFENNDYYDIPNIDLIIWQNDSDVLTAIANAEAAIGDGTTYESTVSGGINRLKGVDTTPRDSDGSPLSRAKVTQTGWHYRLHGIEVETSVISSVYEKKADNSNFYFSSLKFFKDVSGTETEITGDDLNQTFLDSNCIKTQLDWEPTHDYELVGGMLQQQAVPSSSVRLWIVGVPDVPAAYGGSKEFVTNIDLKFFSDKGIILDGRAPKFLAYSATYHTNKMRFVFRHNAGFKHKIHINMEIYKP
jgi:hypothetical protein